MKFEPWWAKHGSTFSDAKQAAYAAWHAQGASGRVRIADPDHPDDADKAMWCPPCVAAVTCPVCESAPGTPCKGAALMGTPWRRGGAPLGSGKRYTVLPHHQRVAAHNKKKREQP